MTSLSGYFRSRDVIACHMTPHPASYNPVGAQTYPNLNLGLLQPLPGDHWSNDITSGSLPVTCSIVTSFPVMSLPPPASYSAIGVQTYPKLDL